MVEWCAVHLATTTLMAAFFKLSSILIFLLSLPNFSFSCSYHPPCDASINIQQPFFTNPNGTECNESYHIYCTGLIPMIQFEDKNHSMKVYIVKNISYSDKTITLLDKEVSDIYHASTCNSLYNFTHPLPHFESATHPVLDNTFFSTCSWGDYNYLNTGLYTDYHSSMCDDYDIYYEMNSEIVQGGLPARCQTPKLPLFEWTLSFGEPAKGFSVLSAGFSSGLELRPECYTKSLCSTQKHKIPHDKIHFRKLIAAASIGGAAALMVSCCVALCWCRSRRKHLVLSKLLSWRWSIPLKLSYRKDPEAGEANYQTHIFSYQELEEATNGFDRELGDGGFGTVYKGKLRDGRIVAVKRLYENNGRRLEQFMNEVDILSCLRHQNLVTLYGCTSRHSRELLLVYEFVANGTVADHLHGARAYAEPLPWHRRVSIALETADALAYLHSVENQIIHRDVKTSNILLDRNFHVKVADFGLSRLFPLDATHISTAPQGTPGYVDPEYHQCYQLTDKSDVYSFGVVLVELISSKPAVDLSRERHEVNLANMALTKIQNCQFEQLVDPVLGYESDAEVKMMIEEVAELAFRCLQSDREMRPSIREVLEVLRRVESRPEKRTEAAGEVQMKEGTRLLIDNASPDSVTERWQSRSTTPNASADA